MFVSQPRQLTSARRGGEAREQDGTRRGGSGLGGNMGRRSDAIIGRNLSMDCTWQMLKDRFGHVGDIKYAEMKDRGVGVIRSGLNVSGVHNLYLF